ncbi:MAG: hypothetical protein FJ308_09965 [Planctomycetes bacterium]|nr:hypothetical protein [Planctomycetota bacterium]
MRAIALDCIAAASDLERWAHRSQEDDYDVDSAALHLDVIEKAQSIFGSLIRILPMGMDLSSTESLRHFPIFDQLALASASESARPVFGGCATAHEAAFGRLTRAFMHIATSLNANLGIEGLHGLSPEQLRDTLSQLEKKYPIKRVLESSDQDYSLSAWIHREWAAASTFRKAEREQAKVVKRIFDDESETGRTPPQPQRKPSWDCIKGELSFDGVVIRKILRIGVAKNVVRVLDTFEEEGWPTRVDSPLSPNSQKHHATIDSLNTGLLQIRFRSDGKGEGFVWEPL